MSDCGGIELESDWGSKITCKLKPWESNFSGLDPALLLRIVSTSNSIVLFGTHILPVGLYMHIIWKHQVNIHVYHNNEH